MESNDQPVNYRTTDRANGNIILQSLLPRLPKRPRRLLRLTSFRYTNDSDTLIILCSPAIAQAIYRETSKFMSPLREVAIELREFGYNLQIIDIQQSILKPDSIAQSRYVSFSLWDDNFLEEVRAAT